MPKRKHKTAAELMARLQGDPEWVRQNEEREAKHSADVAQLRTELEPEQNPILSELSAVGCVVNSVWDLVNTGTTCPASIPVLCKHLGLARSPVLREGIARALTVPEARGVAGRKIVDELMRKFDEHSGTARWALANALAVVADSSLADEIKAMVADASYEDVHERLRAALNNLRAR